MNVENGKFIEGYLEYIHVNKNLSKNTIKSYKDDLIEFVVVLELYSDAKYRQDNDAPEYIEAVAGGL